MTGREYKNRVIELFKSGKATEEQYAEMANAVLDLSEADYTDTKAIDLIVDPESVRDIEAEAEAG